MLVLHQEHGEEMLILHQKSNVNLMFRLWQDILTKRISGELLQDGNKFTLAELPRICDEETNFYLQHNETKECMFIVASSHPRYHHKHVVFFDDPKFFFVILTHKKWKSLIAK